jgi:5-methylcytosine-specific restriction protein B
MVNTLPDDADTIALASASRPKNDIAIAREVAEIFEHMLGDGCSVLDPATTIWTAAAAEELRRRIEDNPILGAGTGQWDKLEQQLTGASRDVVLLAAELIFLREQPLSNAATATRREHLARILKMSDPVATIPAWMNACLDRPTGQAGFNGGQGYNGRLWLHLVWAATFVRDWRGLSDDERAGAAGDPWRMQRIMLDAGDGTPDIRNAMLFLAFPDAFEPISSANMKTQIRSGLADRIGGPSGTDEQSLDRDLLAIRASLARDIAAPFNFWSPTVREMWDASPSSRVTRNDEPRPRHYWMYSPGARASEWDTFQAAGIMAIGWQEIGDIAEYPDREAIRRDLAAASDSTSSMKNDVLCLWQFQNEIAIGDIVYAKRGRKDLVGRGEIVSEARFEPERGEYSHIRSVKWTHNGSWPHPGDAVTKTLTDITSYRDYVGKLEAIFGDREEDDIVTDELVTPAPPYDRAAFLNEVYLDEESYDRLHALLLRKKNVILAGPPGVGKTFAAKRLAYSIMGAKDPARVLMVQFHQSYSYEDFMMGYRPTESGGFALSEGPFYRFCEEARKDDADRPYFFIIDEINRGNMSKIFGELLMLIEADKRGQELRLLYKNETFSVPPNVHIIGMMNTADRGLAVLDYALRRRFGFFHMTPGFDSTGFTTRQKKAESPALDALINVIVKLNQRISEDPALGAGFAIGHSFLSLSSDDIADDEWLSSVVEDELVPLLDEYWFDEATTANEWAEKLRGAVR